MNWKKSGRYGRFKKKVYANDDQCAIKKALVIFNKTMTDVKYNDARVSVITQANPPAAVTRQ